MQAGFTRQQAMLAQLYTAMGAMVGTIIGLTMEGEQIVVDGEGIYVEKEVGM
jgi:hypothetical protein